MTRGWAGRRVAPLVVGFAAVLAESGMATGQETGRAPGQEADQRLESMRLAGRSSTTPQSVAQSVAVQSST